MKISKKTGMRLFAGSAIGCVCGLRGGGGGMLAVPLLKKTGLGVQKAHATAIAVIAPASLSGGAVYLMGGGISPALLVPVVLGVALGGALGARLLGKLSATLTEAIFAVLMLICGIRMVL